MTAPVPRHTRWATTAPRWFCSSRHSRYRPTIGGNLPLAPPSRVRWLPEPTASASADVPLGRGGLSPERRCGIQRGRCPQAKDLTVL